MNNIATHFSINDLENLSGIKAHTIRIWEKRYNILTPERTDTNIRNYSIENLQKLLNVSLLVSGGMKISKAAKLSDEELRIKALEFVTRTKDKQYFMDAFKVAMLNFDQRLFDKTYNDLLAEFSFHEIFTDAFIPLLFNIGIEWQSKAITPAHEHFMSELISQKLQVNIDRARQHIERQGDETYVLFLPLNEIHDLGLKFIHYHLVSKGAQVVYLGQSVPLESLVDLSSRFDKLTYISYFTIKPEADQVDGYLTRFDQTLLKGTESKLWLLGRNVREYRSGQQNIEVFDSLNSFLIKK